jgi:hypothetical protein
MRECRGTGASYGSLQLYLKSKGLKEIVVDVIWDGVQYGISEEDSEDLEEDYDNDNGDVADELEYNYDDFSEYSSSEEMW